MGPLTRRVLKSVGAALLALVLLPLLAAVVFVAALNTGAGQRLAERLIAQATGGEIAVEALSGRFPDALRARRVTLRDTAGPWLVIEDVVLDWSPWALTRREVRIDKLAAARVDLARLPKGAATSAPTRRSSELPVPVTLESLHVARVELGPALTGAPAVLEVDVSGRFTSFTTGEAQLQLRRVDGEGQYSLQARADAATLSAQLRASEPPSGLVARLAGLPDVGALSLQAEASGPWKAADTHLSLSAGPLRAEARGRVDVQGETADLDITATAPAMAPRPDLSWQSVGLDAHVHGPFTHPKAAGSLRIEALQAADAAIRRLSAEITGDAGMVSLDASAEGVRVPGPKPDLLEAAPLHLQAQIRLDAPDRRVVFTLSHPLAEVKGNASTAGAIAAHASVTLPDLAPLAALGAVDLQGRSTLALTTAIEGEATNIDASGTIGITGGLAPVPALLGPDAHLDVAATLRGSDLTLSRLQLAGAALQLGAEGTLKSNALDLTLATALSDLAVLSPRLKGSLNTYGHVRGPMDALAADAEAAGEFGTPDVEPGPVTVSLQATGLPSNPSGRIEASATLDGTPLSLTANAVRDADGTLHVEIPRSDWKSAHAEAALTLSPGQVLPAGHLDMRMTKLEELRRILGLPLAGSVIATLDVPPGQDRAFSAKLRLEARDFMLAGTGEIRQATLNATVTDPMGNPVTDARFSADGLRAFGIAGNLRLDASGPQDRLALRATSSLQGIGGPGFEGKDLNTRAAATLDAPGRSLAVSSLEATWAGETLRLLAPARVSFADGVAMDRVRLGLRNAVLDVAGRVAPTLDLTASLRNVTADLARIVVPDIQAEGALQADARLTGTADSPAGTVRLSATGLRLTQGPAAALPPASLTANATLRGMSAQVEARAAAGRNYLTVTGTAPIEATGAMNLRAQGSVDLVLFDPLLAAAGRSIRGQATLDGVVTGTLAAPRPSGSLRLARGEIQDFGQGVRVHDITALVEANGDSLRISRFAGKAGEGTIGLTGSIGLAPPMPVNITLTAGKARPLSSDLLTPVLDANVTLRGEVHGALLAAGTIHLDRADIRVPERLPAQVAVLDVRRPGQKPPPPPAPPPDVALDLTLDSPGRIFVRGRGLDAQLAGRLHLGGSLAALQPSGGFTLRRGTFDLAGQTLSFTSGQISFTGSSGIDPSLNFVATSTANNIVATLTVGGYASKPTITLSSVPELPQDEILSQLLFKQSASTLGAFQLASMAAALAQVSGVGGGFDPLSKLRQGLGLDRLSLGSGPNNRGSPMIEAGTYLAPGVYVSAKQSTSGQGTLATLQIDLTQRLKLETGLGTGGTTSATGAASTTETNGAKVGLTYQFDY
jgi:translocation and assembly module TamB